MRLEFLICGSPTDAFFSQMAFFRLCLSHLGGDHAAARLVCVFGDHQSAEIPARWRPWFHGIEVHWAHEPGAENPYHVLQHNMRFDLLDPGADVSVLCDADVAILRPMDTLAAELQASPALAGTIAHYHFPWPERDERMPSRDWPELARAVLDRADIPRPFRYTLLEPDAPSEAPFYINYGVLAGTPELLRRFHERDMALRPGVAKLLGDWWAPQVSLSLTCADLDLPVRALPMRWNFPNDPLAERLYPEEMAQIVFLHYLRGHHFQRSRLFAEPECFAAFLEKPLTGSNALFRDHVARVANGRYPFPE